MRGIEDVVYFWFVYGLIVMIGGNCLVPLLVDRLLASKVVVISFSVKHTTAQTVQLDVMFTNAFGHCWCARILFGSGKRLLLVAQFKFLDHRIPTKLGDSWNFCGTSMLEDLVDNT